MMRRLLLCFAILGAGILLLAQERFDIKVRNYFFTGFQGDEAALAKGMKICEDELAKNPQNPEAMVWHGSGIYFLAGQAFRKGDREKGMELWLKGQDEMDKGVTLAPERVGVRIPRGAVLLASSRYILDPTIARPLIEKAVADFEKTYELQKPVFEKMGSHPKGELMLGLADGYSRLGESDKAQVWFERIQKELKNTAYEDSANLWMKTKSLPARQAGCLGCHMGQQTEKRND